MKKNSARPIISKSSFAIKATTFYVFCFCVCVCTRAQFMWLNPKPSGYDNISVVFVSPQTGYLLNTNGDLFQTGDAGGTWQLANSFASPFCMQIVDSTGVIGAANGTVFVSSDNGSNWQQLNTGINDNFGTVNIVGRDTFFLSSTTLSDVIYETTDRGRTWATLHCGVPIHAISFANGKVGFVGSSQMTIIKTTDGGITWKTLSQSGLGISVNAIQFLNTDTGFVARGDSLLVTYDGGGTFSSYGSFGGATVLYFLNATDGWCAGSDGIILATHDGGKTATNVSFNAKESNNILSFNFLTSNTGFAVGMFGQILKTINGGTNWALYSSPAYVPVTATAFGSASTGYATTRNNVFKTADTGNTWQQLPFTTGNAATFDYSVFEKAWFANADTGLLTSSLPAAIHVTTDGGNNWTTSVPATSFMMTDVSDVQFLNKKVGFMALVQTEAGKSGGILKTTDGGLTWQLISGGGPYDPGFDHIFFIDEKTGFGSSYATLYKTTDSSKTWAQVYASPQFAGFTSLLFTSPDKGFISDDQGFIIKTTDSGKTWVNSSTPLTFLGGIGTLKFYNGQVGYFTSANISGPGNYGSIYQTIDSGATWQFKKNVGGSAISFTPDTVVVVSGYAAIF